jgi:hypothetical protein
MAVKPVALHGDQQAFNHQIKKIDKGVEITQPERVNLHVFMIGAKEPLSQEEGQAMKRKLATSLPGIFIDPRIAQLKPHLEGLGFRRFYLLEDEKAEIELLKKKQLQFKNGNKLCVRALYNSREQIGLWIKWSGTDGGEILDTRMHLIPNQAILAGSELVDSADSSNREASRSEKQEKSAIILGLVVK